MAVDKVDLRAEGRARYGSGSADSNTALDQYRPFVKKWVYLRRSDHASLYAQLSMFPPIRAENMDDLRDSIELRVAARRSRQLQARDMNLFMHGDGDMQFARYRYTSSGERIDNITDWAERKFREHYGAKAGVSKDAIFAYVYAALHDPVWRETYAINLKRGVPAHPLSRRLPALGRLGAAAARPARRLRGGRALAARTHGRAGRPRPRRRAGAEADAQGRPRRRGADPRQRDPARRRAGRGLGLPARQPHALDWVLDQHREKTPKDPTIRARFDSYRFADHKERVAGLLARVTRVSVETVAIVAAMRAASRPAGRAA